MLASSALILLGHGSARRGGGNPSLQGHVAAMRERRLFAAVHGAALYGAPSPGDALAAAAAGGARRIVVAPLFMCDGQFSRTVLPRAFGLDRPGRGGGVPVQVCAPLGERPELTTLLLNRAGEAAAQAGFLPGLCDLLLIGHGSTRDPASRRATERHANRARAAGLFLGVRTAFLDQPPYLAEVLQVRTRPTIAVGLFAAGDRHAGTDIPRLVAAHPGPPLRCVPAIGEDPAIPDLVLVQVAAALQEPAVA